MARRRDGAEGVVGEAAGADDRRVADAARPLEGDAAGRRRGGDAAVGVDRDGADGVVAPVEELADGPGEGGHGRPLRARRGRDEVVDGRGGEAPFARERVGARAREQDVVRPLHDGPRHRHRVEMRAQGRDRARLEIAPVHDHRVELDVARGREHGAAARVERRVRLQDAHRRLDRVDRAAAGERGPARLGLRATRSND